MAKLVPMSSKDPAVDAYIARAQPFARPILKHIRRVVHRGCPDVQEEMKWSVPHFSYKGMFCGMAAFKTHCTFGFWKQSLLRAHGLPARDEEAMGQFGRITSLKGLPSDATLVQLVRFAKKLNDDGVKPPKRNVTPVKDRIVTVPPVFMKAIRANKKALATFATFSYSKKKDYVDWVVEAKTDVTRDRRVATSVEWMAQGKARNWKYESC